MVIMHGIYKIVTTENKDNFRIDIVNRKANNKFSAYMDEVGCMHIINDCKTNMKALAKALDRYDKVRMA